MEFDVARELKKGKGSASGGREGGGELVREGEGTYSSLRELGDDGLLQLEVFCGWGKTQSQDWSSWEKGMGKDGAEEQERRETMSSTKPALKLCRFNNLRVSLKGLIGCLATQFRLLSFDKYP